MADYPQLQGAPPQIFTPDHVRDWEAGLQQLAVTNAVIQKCERCNIPVQTSRQECDSLCDFFHRMIDEERGQQAANPLPLS